MYYSRFEATITDRYGVVVQGWPLKVFTAPGNIGSKIELTVLINAWKNDTARFRRLSHDELDAWRKTRFDELQATVPITATATDNPVDPAVSPAPTDAAASPVDTTPPATPVPTPAISAFAPSVPTAPVTSSSVSATPVAASTHVFAISTNQLLPEKKQRNKRKDFGTKRGPNKRTREKLAAAAAATLQVSGHNVAVPGSR